MTSTSGTVQTFADCLREIIAENGWTLDVLAEATGYKSKTSVSRILREESSAKNREHFLEQLRQSKLLRPEELDRLQSALEVSALGADKVCARQVLLDLILGHQIDLVIDIPSQGAERSHDGFIIRRNAIETGVNVLTAIDTAEALVTSLENPDDEMTLTDIAKI